MTRLAARSRICRFCGKHTRRYTRESVGSDRVADRSHRFRLGVCDDRAGSPRSALGQTGEYHGGRAGSDTPVALLEAR
jgi:hypothetical protein